MRSVTRLVLERYGAFTGLEIELGRQLAVVVGVNEAGKTTARSALADLLWGVPLRSEQVFVHGRPSLEVRAEICDGEVRHQVVRTGRGLASADGSPLPAGLSIETDREARDRWLRELGLDHEGLRAGGRDVFDGTGDLAELVFQAQTGLDVTGLLKELATEADQLYKPHKGSKNVLVRTSLARYHEAETALHHAITRAEDVDRAQQEVQQAGRRATEASRQVLEARRRGEILGARRRAAETSSQLHHAEAERRAITEQGPALDAGQLAEHAEAARLLAEAEGQQRQAAARRTSLDQQHAEVTVEPELLEVADQAEELWQEKSTTLDAATRAEDLHGQAQAAFTETRGALLGLGVECPPEASPGQLAEAVDRVRLPTDVIARLDRHAERYVELDRQASTAADELVAAEADADRTPAPQLPLELDEAALATAVDGLADALRERDEAQQAEADATATRRNALVDARALDPDRLVPPSLPGVAESDDARTGLRTARERLRTAQSEHERLEAELAAVDDEHRGTVVPAEQERLADARARRDATWERLRTEWVADPVALGASERLELAEELDRALAGTDDAAEAVLAQAVATAVAQAQATERARQRDQLAAQTDQARVTTGHAQAAVEAAEERWRTVWASRQVAVPDLEQSELVLARLSEAQQAHTAWLAARDRGVVLTPRVAERASLVAELLTQAGRLAPTEDAERLVALGRSLVVDVRQDATRREVRGKAFDAVRARRRVHEQAMAALDQWQDEWAGLLQAAGLNETLGVPEWPVRRDGARAAADALAQGQELAAQAAGLDAMVAHTVGRVEELVHLVGSGPGGGDAPGPDGSVWPRVERLWKRVKASREHARSASLLADQIDQAAREEDRARSQVGEAQARLDALVAACGVIATPEGGDRAGLDAAAVRGQRLVELARTRDELTARLVPLAAQLDLSVAELESGTDADAGTDAGTGTDAGVESLELAYQFAQRELDRLTAEEQDRRADVGRAEQQKITLEQRTSAAHARAVAEESLAEVAETARRYAVAQLQRRLLAAQVDRIGSGQTSQVLEHAGRLLADLTQGRYVGLRADHAEKRLQVRRRDDRDHGGLPGLSEATADQVFLALRLAGIAQRQSEYAAAGRALAPVLLDDVLLTFDDERTAAALRVLADLSATTQVVLLTHHERVGELASSLGRPEVQVTYLRDPAPLQAGDVGPPGGGVALGPVGVGPARDNGVDPARIREWARDNGYEVGDRGRIAQDVQQAYHEAHGA